MHDKPMLTKHELIEHCKNKGISFNCISEQEAQKYLSHNNNYFKLTAYRKNYDQYETGPNKGKYQNLDFAYLIELARLDAELRKILLSMCLDIEHFLKVALIDHVEEELTANKGEDGYKIVSGFLLYMKRNFGRNILNEIVETRQSTYCVDLVNKYLSDMPIWAFVELISFGDLLRLLQYYSSITNWSLPVDDIALDTVRQIRNATAHNNCILNNLRPQKNVTAEPQFLTRFISSCGITKDARRKRTSNKRVRQITYLIYIYQIIVTSEHSRLQRMSELKALLTDRFVKNSSFFKSNEILLSTYDYFIKIINVLH